MADARAQAAAHPARLPRSAWGRAFMLLVYAALGWWWLHRAVPAR